MKEANNHSISIVVVSNPLSVIMANKIVFDYHMTETNILIVDYGMKKESFLNEILECAKKRPWTTIINLSKLVTDEKNSAPSLRKRLTRKYKSLPLIRSVHSALQKKALRSIEKNIEHVIILIDYW